MRKRLTFLFILLIQFSSFSQKESESWIDNLEEGDSLRIEFRSSGCFHRRVETSIFNRLDDEIVVTNRTDTVVLDSSGRAKVNLFQAEIRKFYVGCTTTDYYEVFLNGKRIKKFKDGSCSWSGYRSYISGLFKNEE